jgi:diguanylate cyclase (GGDEF)-like protein
MTEADGRVELGIALGRRAEECAVLAEQRVSAFPWVGSAPSDEYVRTRQGTLWFATLLVARWMVCGAMPEDTELEHISRRGRRVAEEGLSVVNLARGYLIWRDVVLEVLGEEGQRLGTDRRVLGAARAVVRATCDGNLMRMARVFDEQLRTVSARLDEERENLRHVALHDQVTGLPNRMLLYDRLSHALAGARRDGRPVAVLLVDLDGFKAVNDGYGHRHGDDVLAEVARRLAGAVRRADTMARLGGDEFVAVLPGAGRETATEIAQRMLDDLCPPLDVAGDTLSIRASVGIALHPGDGDEPEQLLLSADRAMYVAKRRGGGMHVAQTPA